MHDVVVVDSEGAVSLQLKPRIVLDVCGALVSIAVECVAVDLQDHPFLEEEVHAMPEEARLLDD